MKVEAHHWATRHVQRDDAERRGLWRGAEIWVYPDIPTTRTGLTGADVDEIIRLSAEWQRTYVLAEQRVYVSASMYANLCEYVSGSTAPKEVCAECNGTRRTIWWEAGMMQDCQRCSRGT